MSVQTALMRFFLNPVVDKTLAIITVTPIAFAIYLRLVAGELDIVKINLLIQAALNVIPMLLRRPATRVSLNPCYFLVAFFAAFWIPFPALERSPGVMIVPEWFGVLLSCIGLLLSVYARLSLGLNIGLVPAQRNLVMDGAYGYVRHPIYTAVWVNYIALLLLHYSELHAGLVCIGIALFMLRSLMEERFLASDPEYAAYMRRVRRRWIPGVV
jgi:protein-S-isoprenylcysteine O-methyltransferase Ste14